MTDVMDDSMSWEQRRELRRKKRQELLAETDRLVKNTDQVASSNASSRISRDPTADDDDDFEKERQKRRREREERRRKEREELEKQLKEEEDSRADRERRREERRRKREEEMEMEYSAPPAESYTSTTVITKAVERHEHNEDEDTTVVTETTEVVEEEYLKNGHHDEQADAAESNEEQNADEAEEEEKEEEEEEEEEETHNGVDDDEPELESKTVYKSTVTTVTVTSKVSDRHDEPNDEGEDADDTDEVKKKLDELKLKRQMSDKKRYETKEDDEDDSDARKERLKQIEERRKAREQKRIEEEERQKAEAAKREAEHQERLRVEREEREKRRAEAEEKRKAMRAKLSQSDDQDQAGPLSPKLMTSPLVSKSLESAGDTSNSDDATVGAEPGESNRQNKTVSCEADEDQGKMSGHKPPAVPRRTQSTRIKLSDYRVRRGLRATESFNESDTGFHPSRPLARKNRTRRSLDAMEQQADDLYGFLSELETKRSSCSGQELLGFLDDQDSNKKQSPSGSPAIRKRASIRDRAQVFQDIKEENVERGNSTVVAQTSKRSVQKPVEKSRVVKSTVLSSRSNDDVRNTVRTEVTVASRVKSNVNSNNSCEFVAETQTLIVKVEKENESPVADSSSVSLKRQKPVGSSDKENSVVSHREADQKAHVKEVSTFAETVTVSHSLNRQRPVIPGKPEHLAQSVKDARHKKAQDRAAAEDSAPVSAGKASERPRRTRRDHCSSGEKTAKAVPAPARPSSNLMQEPVDTEPVAPAARADHCASSGGDRKAAPRRAGATARNRNNDARSPSAKSPSVVTATVQREDKEVSNKRVEQLNKHMTDSPKTTKSRDAAVARVDTLDSRMEKYTKQASKQEVKKTASVTKAAGDVSDRRNKWERGEVTSTEKSNVRKEPVIGAGGISSRKNLWESGKVAGATASPKSKDVADIKGGAGFSSRKNQWLKVSQQAGASKKSESPVTMKTGVMSRLNQWEKGSVTGASHDKPKGKSDVPAVSGVGNRRAKFENIGDSPKPQATKTPVRLASDVSDRRNKWESKASEPAEAKSNPSKRDEAADERASTPDRSYDDDAASSQSGSQGRGRYQDDDDEYSDED